MLAELGLLYRESGWPHGLMCAECRWCGCSACRALLDRVANRGSRHHALNQRDVPLELFESPHERPVFRQRAVRLSSQAHPRVVSSATVDALIPVPERWKSTAR
jgi:hypothetical protein